ncbi:MAG TPA: hypothetical protein VHX17_06945 [Candidatus Cybelea sp.]|nr:hypothetical protein [Candidatus Cybelea sp.]
MKPSSFFVLAGSALLAFAVCLGAPRGQVAAAATPPPSPPPINGAVTPPPPPAAPLDAPSNLPTPSASFPVGGTPPPAKSTATPSPPPSARKGLDGVWEVAIQHPNTTDYTHFYIRQQGDQLSGTYLDSKNKKYPLVGTLEGQNIRLIVTLPGGTTILAEARLDGTTDMVGILTMPGGDTPFTASYRAKEKWIENINASPGGISQPGGYTPP